MCTFFMEKYMEEKYIKILLKLSKKALTKNEVPFSCILVKNNKIISKAYNKKNIKKNPLMHAEVLCLQKAYKKLHRWNLNDCILYVSLEPCNMCKMIIEESRIKKVFYILEKGKISNKYDKTQYEQMFSSYEIEFKKNIEKFFNKLRKN